MANSNSNKGATKPTPKNEFEEFENESTENLESVEPESNFFSFETNETYNFKFLGWTEWDFKGEKQEGVRLEDKEGKEWRSSLTVLKNRLRSVTDFPRMIRVMTKNKERGENGKYLDLDVFIGAKLPF